MAYMCAITAVSEQTRWIVVPSAQEGILLFEGMEKYDSTCKAMIFSMSEAVK